MVDFLLRVALETWSILKEASVFLLFGFVLAGVLATVVPARLLSRLFGTGKVKSVLWGAAIGAAWSGNHYGWGGGNDININRNTNISTGGNTINRGQGGGQASQWKSNKQPGQVSSSVGKTAPSNRAGDARGGAGGGARASAQPAGGFDRGGGAGAGGDRGGAGAGGGARASTQPAGGGGRGGGGDSAFGGYNSGRQTQMDSSRGASSRGSSSYGGGGGSRPTASSGASRGGGGGAARGGGGGRGGGGRR